MVGGRVCTGEMMSQLRCDAIQGVICTEGGGSIHCCVGWRYWGCCCGLEYAWYLYDALLYLYCVISGGAADAADAIIIIMIAAVALIRHSPVLHTILNWIYRIDKTSIQHIKTSE